MTVTDQPPPPPPESVTLPASELALLVELLTEIDDFLRSPSHHDAVFAALRAHLAANDRPDAGYLIDAVSFTAAYLRRLANGVGGTAERNKEGTYPACRDEAPARPR